MANEKHGSKTLFVRNLSYATTNESLETVFSDVGPVKSCFVVKDKESGKCRGFGYVKFTLFEDAEKALNSVKKVDGRHVHIVFSNKKEKKKRFGQPVKAENEDTPETTETKEKPKEAAKPHPKDSKGKNNQKIPVKGQKQTPNPLNEGKRARLIVRNLAFKCTKEELKNAFEKFGDVVDVHIPVKAGGKKLGFGFVQFANKTQAGMAVRENNGKKISGRVVAVDWALPKDKFESKLAEKSADKDVSNVQDENMEVDDDDEDNDEVEKATSSKVKVTNKRKADDKSSSEDEESEDEESEDEESEDEESEDESSNEDDDEDSDEDDSGIEEGRTPSKKPNLPERESDVGEGRTLFIRNLPFNADNEELEEFFSQFGEVNYARVVLDRNSGMPKGSAFVQFASKDSTDSCVTAASNESLSVGGRQLLVSLAVTRQQAGDLVQKKDKKKEEKDSRNLYLAREGMIRPGTEAAKDVPPADLSMRAKIDEVKRKKLKSQNIFVSSTRLCVHNIPPTVGDQQLKTVLLKAAEDKQAKLVECRIMRDLNRVNSQGVGKSRGYAFCAFTQHEHALNALRHLNNNPAIFGDKKRPIVEFSLENRNALEAKQKRVEKSKAKIQQQKVQESQAKAAQSAKQQETQNKRKRKFKNKKGKNLLEAKKEQDKVARSLYKGPVGLPSHSGPKQRHKPRPGQQDRGKGKNKMNRNMQNRQQQQPQMKMKKEKAVKLKNPSKKRKDFDSFDKLVASYKQKIMGSAKF